MNTSSGLSQLSGRVSEIVLEGDSLTSLGVVGFQVFPK